jgi:DNA-binding response OmpR family regulator
MAISAIELIIKIETLEVKVFVRWTSIRQPHQKAAEKIVQILPNLEIISTVYGIGYRFNEAVD